MDRSDAKLIQALQWASASGRTSPERIKPLFIAYLREKRKAMTATVQGCLEELLELTYIDGLLDKNRVREIVRYIQKLETRCKPPAEQPVAWQFFCESADKWVTTTSPEIFEEDGYAIRPLYASQPDQPVEIREVPHDDR